MIIEEIIFLNGACSPKGNGLLFFAPDGLPARRSLGVGRRLIPYDKEFELYSMAYRSSSETLLERSAP